MKFRIALLCLAATFGQSVGHAADDARDEIRIGRGSADGRILLGELGCTSCHDAGTSSNRILHRQAPRLGEVGARITPAYLRAFLAKPHQMKPGSPMPDLLHDLTGEKRDAAVEDLAHFLAGQGGPLVRTPTRVFEKQIERGKTLYHSVGCAACHQPFEAAPKQKIDPNVRKDDDDDPKVPVLAKEYQIPLGRIAAKTTTEALARFLINPLHVRPSGRMPALDLTADDAISIAAYLRFQPVDADAPKIESVPFALDPEKSTRGRVLFASLGCASCHDTGTFREPMPLDLSAKGTKITGFAPTGNNSPPSEGPFQAFDNNPRTKYLNHGKAGSGLFITTVGPPMIVSSLALTSANDFPNRDPASYLLEGSNDGKVFARIDGRAVPLFPDRFKTQSFSFDNSEAYSIYRISFPTLAGGPQADAVQIAEVRLLASPKALPGIVSTLKAPALDKLDPANGCLSDKASPKSPRYALSGKQRDAVRSALTALQKPAMAPAPAERIDMTMTALNCYACHSRGGKGGPELAKNGYFGYEIVVDLGDEGRLPPALNEVGCKLTPEGFDEALFSGQRYRTYMGTRMPQFGRANIGHLPELFAKADSGKVPSHKPTVSLSMPSDGRRLIGKNMLTCVTCHAWGGSRVPGAEGLDLLRASKRLQPDWFHALLVEPQTLRPRTRMPSSWPEGKSLFPKIQNGDVHKQIDAIWAYLALGLKALPPDGIAPTGKAPFLVPGDEPIVFRTFIDGMSAYAILVGFPQRVHVAFDANRVRMSLAWTGDFISPDSAWEGRGGNYAKIPSTDIVRFPTGPTFAVLESQTSAWPAEVTKPKLGSSRTPPGWRYLGYRLDEKQIPTFQYKAGPVTVEETPTVESTAMSARLVRRFQLKAAAEVKDFYLRVAVGKKIEKKDGAFVIDGRLSYRIKSDPDATPVIRDSGGRSFWCRCNSRRPGRARGEKGELKWS